MIKSMTGFGRCEIQKDAKKFTVELKSVNHRYLDVNIRMPKKLNFFETAIRTLLKSYANRGKIDIFITYEDTSQAQVSVKYNSVIAAEYLKHLRQMSEEFGLEDDIRVSVLSRYPEVFTMEEQTEDEEELWNGLKEALEGAFACGCAATLYYVVYEQFFRAKTDGAAEPLAPLLEGFVPEEKREEASPGHSNMGR